MNIRAVLFHQPTTSIVKGDFMKDQRSGIGETRIKLSSSPGKKEELRKPRRPGFVPGHTPINFSDSVKKGVVRRPPHKRDEIIVGSNIFNFNGILQEITTVGLTDAENAFGMIITSANWGKVVNQIQRCMEDGFMPEFNQHISPVNESKWQYNDRVIHQALPEDLIIWFFFDELNERTFRMQAFVSSMHEPPQSINDCKANHIYVAACFVSIPPHTSRANLEIMRTAEAFDKLRSA